MTDISDLEAALKRAETTGQTDDDIAKYKLAHKLGRELIDVIEKNQPKNDPNSLSTLEVEKVLAGVLGIIIRSSAYNQVGALLISAEMAQIVVSAATEDWKR